MRDADEALSDDKPATDAHAEVHRVALERFDRAVMPQIPVRERALEARRFVSIPGAQWEGAWGDQFDNSIKVEINKVRTGVRKIENDYRQNRIVPDFRPDGGDSDQGSADTLDGMHRADSYRFKAQQARDNAFSEASRGGFGAYRLANEWDDPYDKQNDAQRINPGLLIADADQCVFFDPDSRLYDKSDAKFAFVLTALSPDALKAEYGEQAITDWPQGLPRLDYEWFRPDTVTIAEYYDVEERDETVAIFTHGLTDEERRVWVSDLGDGESADLILQGWQRRDRRMKRRRVHKYVMSGAEVLADKGFIAGPNLPIVPVYGNREWIDGVEHFTGFVQGKMDPQRLYNSTVSKIAETNAMAPREVPIFAPEQMTPNLAREWSDMNIKRAPFALVNPLRNEDGSIASAGPIGKVEPPSVSPAAAALIDVANRDLVEDTQDGADTVKANVSAEAMDIAATRIDERSGIYLDNMRQSVQREGEIYLGMVPDVYWEPQRRVDTMSEDGDDGSAILSEVVQDNGTVKLRNDFASGRYKVIADVTEATATRRDKTVKSSLHIAAVATEAQNAQLANAALLTAVMNQDGEGMSDLQQFARKQAVGIGLVPPNEEEQAAMAQEQQAQQPDPTAVLADAQAKALMAGAAKDTAQAQKLTADTQLSGAKVVETLASAAQKHAEIGAAPQPANDAEQAERWANARLREAQANRLATDVEDKRIRTGAELESAA